MLDALARIQLGFRPEQPLSLSPRKTVDVLGLGHLEGHGISFLRFIISIIMHNQFVRCIWLDNPRFSSSNVLVRHLEGEDGGVLRRNSQVHRIPRRPSFILSPLDLELTLNYRLLLCF